MATKYCILYWQEIPSFVEATDGETKQKIQLSDRFQELIDKAAMRRKLAGTDAYLEGFNKGEQTEASGSPEEVAKMISDKLETDFDAISEAALAKR